MTTRALRLSLILLAGVYCALAQAAQPDPLRQSILGEWTLRPSGQGPTAIFRFDEDGTVTSLTAESFGEYFVLSDGRVLIEFPDSLILARVRQLGEKRVLQGVLGLSQPINLSLSRPAEGDAEEADRFHRAFVEQATRVQAHQVEGAIRNNLRQFTAAAQQYMLEHGVEKVTYDDIVGEGKPIEQLTPINGEDYTGLTMDYETFSISVTDANGREIQFGL